MVDHGGAAATIHLGTPSPGASSGLPARSGEQPSNARAAAPGAAFWPCFRWGLPSHPGHPGCWCALTAPFHPYHREVAVCFLWHYPASHLGLPLAITPLCEVRTFLGSYRYDSRSPGQLVRPINVLLGAPIPRPRHTGRMPQLPSARYLLRAKDLVDARYAEPITVDDLAAAAGLSRAHFSRMFTRTFGESPRAYLQTRRLERAAALLRHTDRSVADICVMVGLASIGSFTTSFARVYGMSPTAYRASLPPASVYARVPSCILRRDTRPLPDSRVKTAHGEKTNGDCRP